jgi:hypothetical protein
MRRNVAEIAPVQEARAQAGEWLQANADRSQWILSGDIGMIAYKAKDCKFIDQNGLTSPDVLAQYRLGGDISNVIKYKTPRYVADTFVLNNGRYTYQRELTMHPVLVERVSDKLFIIVGELK